MALDFAAGCAGGAAGVLAGFPLDTVKVRIQTQDVSRSVKYSGTFQCLSTIIKKEGARSLYRGMSSPLYGVAFMNAIGFGVYGNTIRRMDNPDSISSITTAGMASGFVQAFFCSPMELVKTQMQVCGDAKGATSVLRDIVKHSGVRGLAKGLGITIAREVPAFGIYFSSYELLVRIQKENTPWVFCCGGISGMLSWMLTYPQDVIKTRVQADEIGRSAKYKSYSQCFKQSVANEGYGVLFRGMPSTLIRAFPVNAVTMGVVTFIMQTLSEEDITAYDAMSRLRLNDGIYLELPATVKKYFKAPIKYHHNVCTRATDGPSIVKIEKPTFAVAPYRLYAENMLNAMPTRVKPKQHHVEVNVGTIRSDVSLNTVLRVAEKAFLPKKLFDDDLSAFWYQSKAFGDPACGDFAMDDDRTPLYVTAASTAASKKNTTKVWFEDDGSEILAPSILAREHGYILRKETITTSDFLLPMNLLSSSNEKIYGFYYVT